jgi:hypothetical protein
MARFRYNRTCLHSPITGQTVRLEPVSPASVPSGLWCLSNRMGTYHRSYCLNKDVYVDCAVWVPRPGSFEFVTRVTNQGNCCQPRLVFDLRGILYLVFTVNNADSTTDVWIAASWDDGRTWRAPFLGIANGSHPTVACGPDGIILWGAHVAGKLAVLRQAPGVAYGDAESFNAKDDAGSDLLIEDDSFHFTPAMRADSPWTLHVLIEGESHTSSWRSSDDGKTWARFT